jgi:hypothetical protein
MRLSKNETPKKMKQPWDAIVWWEIRRVPYNAALAILGIITISALLWIGSHLFASGEGVDEPLGLIVGAVFYGLAANVFYTLGWISELLWSGGDTSKTQPFRKRVFFLGLIISCVLTLLPAVLIPALWWMLGFH